jgi:carboxyl-terminal processing protease
VKQALRRATLAAVAALFATAGLAVEQFEALTATDKHTDIARRVTRIIEELHYSRPRIDNSLSSAIFDRYLDSLDASRLYFLGSDLTAFGSYRYELDDLTRNGDLGPIFEIFNLYRTRTAERVEYALTLLEQEPDFTLDEEFQFDRDEMPWPATEVALQELWRQRVKNDGLSLVLTGKTWAESAEILRERYERLTRRVGQVTADDVFETYMNAVAHTIDPHSSYLSPRNSEEYRIQMSLSYDGIGASLQLEDDYVKVINVIPGGPAFLDGQLKPEDRITAVGEGDGGELVDVIGWRLDDVVQKIRGPGGTTVRLQVLAGGSLPGSERVIALVRDKVKLEEQAAKSRIVEVPLEERNYRIGVIDIPSFYQDYAARSRGDEDYISTTRDVARLVQELEEQNIDGLLLDLRANGGGHLSEATELSGLFIDRGPVVQLRETRGNVQVLDDPNPDMVYDGPLAVLVDRYSASASEIFAGAIQDYQRGIVIGQQTFGKGTVQNLFNLDRFMRAPGYGQLTLTIGKYYRVTGESTQNRGVLPDIELPSAIDVSQVGESTRDTALPWDRIESTRFRASAPLESGIAELQAHLQSRASEDPDFRYFNEDIAAFGELQQRTTLSLNLERRKAERDTEIQQSLDRENRRRIALGLDPLTSIEELETQTPLDVLLEQASAIVADMIAMKAPTQEQSRQLLTGPSRVPEAQARP